MSKDNVIKANLKWEFQPRQLEFMNACGLGYAFGHGDKPAQPAARIILYGGSAGGGKTDSLLMAAFIACVTWPGCKVGYFRRRYPDLEGPGGAIMRSHEFYGEIAKYHGGNRRWIFPKRKNGGQSIVQFCHCQNEDDVHNYNSQQFDILLIDESTQMSEFQLRYLLTRNRATVNNLIPFCAMATNPGGVSHNYHLKKFVEAGPPSVPVDVEVENGLYEKHIFIPARLSDNKVLEDRDPNYRFTLERMPEDLRRALLDGDWHVFKGQYFNEFRVDEHVVAPFAIPENWRLFGSIDWGFAAPCAVYLHTIDPAMGRVYTIKELYVTEHRAADVAKLMKEMVGDREIGYIKASPDMWHERGLGSKASPGEIIAEEFIKVGLPVEPADNRRVLGWNRMREYLSHAPDEKPWWQIFNTCSNLIRTLPQLIYDKNKVEDVSPECEDHGPEAARYFLFSRPSPNDGAMFLPGEAKHFSGDIGYSDDEDDDLADMGVDAVHGFYGR